ncbi:MAG: LPS export ABC transporter permease LptG [Porticoccaceae bacterium]|nr:LPS export ABC transporter permease LptG [Porticoccaceae bacterium]
MSKRLSRYIGVNVLSAITVALVALIGLDVVAGIIDQMGDIKNNYQFADVLIYTATKLPSTIYEYIPLASLIGCLVGLGMLATNSEVVVMRAAGVSLMRIVLFVFRPVVLFILLAALIGEYFSPYLDQLADSKREYLLKGESALDSTSGFWARERGEFIHFNAVFPGGVLFGVTRYKLDTDRQLKEASFSSRATFNKTEGFWVEENVSSTIFLENQIYTRKWVTRKWQTELTPEVLALNVLPADALSAGALNDHIDYLEERKADVEQYRLAFWRKVLQPVAIFSLVLVGIAFVFGPLRQATVGFRVFVGVLFGISFKLLSDILGPLSIVFEMSPILAILTPIVICFSIGLILLRRAG